MLPSTAELVAQFLRANGYDETLSSFIKEAGLPPDIGAASDGSITIETILQEKKTFDLSLNFEKLGVDDKDRPWAVQAPTKPTIIECLPSRSNLLSISVVNLSLPSALDARQYIAVTTANRQLHLIDPRTPTLDLAHSYSGFQDSPILDMVALVSRYLLVASMSGKLYLHDAAVDKTLDVRNDHSKYLVKLATWSSDSFILVASAGWDANVFLYKLDTSADCPQLGEPIATLTLPSIPETICFVESPEGGAPILLVARRDSSFLHYYAVPGPESLAFTLVGKQNLSPHSNAWVAFTPSDVQICPTNPLLAAVATSSTPHMKLLIVKLLIPPMKASEFDAAAGPHVDESLTQASQARAELLVADREEAAIFVNVSTLAPQTACQ
ncbi:Nn.00g036400.m01.CDS01 [Neocucurbitaria sp. VM-36]